MQVTAKITNLKISPKKVRLVASLMRGKQVGVALGQLKFLNKGSAQSVGELIKAAIANAEHNFKLDKENLFVKEIRVDKGQMLKRFMPRAHGRAAMIRKKMSHVYITLEEINPTKDHKGVKPKKGETTKVDSRSNIKTLEIKELHKDDKEVSVETEEKGKEIHDPRMEGRHRHQQHVDKSTLKAKGGAQKKTSVTRKAG